MYQLMLMLLIGIVCGRLLKENKLLRFAPKVVLAAVACLLLVMGAKIGGDPEILASLPRLGGKALIFAVLSIAGSVVLSLPLMRKRPS